MASVPAFLADGVRPDPLNAPMLAPVPVTARPTGSESLESGEAMNKRWLAIGAVGVVIVGGVVTARGGDKDTKKGGQNTPFRLGKVQAEDLQVSVREVGVVDPVSKVDVKSTVSGRVVGLKVREGAVVQSGEVLAEVEPDVTQAQNLSDVQGSLTQSRLKFADSDQESLRVQAN